MSRRTERINALLREQLSELVQRSVKDPRITGLISITAVEVTKDLSQAKVHVSVYGTPEERANVMAGLASAATFFRRELRDRLELRWIPNLLFIEDTSIERAARVLDLMRHLEQSDHKVETEP